MGFRANQSEAIQQSTIKPEGDYECLIIDIDEYTTKNGSTGLHIKMVIRNDVDQTYKNGYIFHTLWKRKEPTEADNQVKGYSFGQVMALGKAAGLPDGKDYDSLEQFCDELIKKPMRVTLKHEEYNGKTQERVSWFNSTKFPDVKHIFKQSESSTTAYAQTQQSYATSAQTVNQNFTETTIDDDLPF